MYERSPITFLFVVPLAFALKQGDCLLIHVFFISGSPRHGPKARVAESGAGAGAEAGAQAGNSAACPPAPCAHALLSPSPGQCPR